MVVVPWAHHPAQEEVVRILLPVQAEERALSAAAEPRTDLQIAEERRTILLVAAVAGGGPEASHPVPSEAAYPAVAPSAAVDPEEAAPRRTGSAHQAATAVSHRDLAPKATSPSPGLLRTLLLLHPSSVTWLERGKSHQEEEERPLRTTDVRTEVDWTVGVGAAAADVVGHQHRVQPAEEGIDPNQEAEEVDPAPSHFLPSAVADLHPAVHPAPA